MRIQTQRSIVLLLVYFTQFLWAAQYARAEEVKAPPAGGADAPALAILDTGRRAYNEGKFDVAVERFREFLKANAQKSEASAAQYGLALSLLELPQKDFPAIAAALQVVVARSDSPDRPYALYRLAAAQRSMALQALDLAAAAPAEAAKLRALAAKQVSDAAKNFNAAGNAFEILAKGKTGAPDQEWLLRSRCDEGDMLLRLEKHSEAAELARKTIALIATPEYKSFEKSAFQNLAYYQLGCASYSLKDYRAAAKALSQLAPFEQLFSAPYTPHARYLMSRIHQLSGENPEAGAGYKALIAEYEVQKKMAAEAMKNPAAQSPDNRARYESLLKPPPEFMARATFYSAQILCEAGEFAEAMAGFTAFLAQFPNNALIDEAKLRLGFCLLQVKNYPEATKLFQALQAHPQLADRAFWWLGRAQLEGADPAKPDLVAAGLKAAIDSFGKAAEKAGALGPSDTDAKNRRGDILLELGDAQQSARLYKESVATYEKIGAEFAGTERAEVALQRQVTALHLAGLYKESDDVCQKFETAYPKSVLLDEVLFRGAENACLSAMAASKDPKAAGTRAVWEKRFDDAIAKYQRLLAKYPEFNNANLAHYGMGSAQYQRGKFDEAFTTLTGVLDADRTGELAAVNYLLGDCLIRQMPIEADDALEAGNLIDKADDAARLLKKYADAMGKAPQAADALLKLGYCDLRRGALIVDPLERPKILAEGRQTYEKILNEFKTSPAIPSAVLERAHIIALQGDIGGAINEYNRFTGEPLKKSPLAPLAMMRQASLLRSQNRFQDAVNLMAECRKRYEDELKKDAVRADWIAQIQYEHALALKESGKPAEAGTIFEGIAKQFEKSAEAPRAKWRVAQCRREELQAALTAAAAVLKKPGAKPEELVAANKSISENLDRLRQTAEAMKTTAESLVPKTPDAKISEIPLRMIYEAAWCCRVLADAEIEAARQKIAAPVLAKIVENRKKSAAPNSPPSVLAAPEIALSDIPPQPSEKLAKEHYESILRLASASALAGRVRLELAELQAQRGQYDAALELLATALEDNPAPDLAERLHLRLATCLIAKDEGKLALVQAQAVTRNPASPLMGEAIFLTGECYAVLKDPNNSIAQFANFRDRDPFRNMGVLTERGLLRLGATLAEAKRWDESRQTLEQLVQRFPQSDHVHEARFGIGTGLQNMGQWDNAYNVFAEITRRTAGEVAARAQVQMGVCRLATKKYPEAQKELSAVASIYDSRDATAESLVNLGHVHAEQNQAAEAKRVWESVTKDFADTKWADVAKKKLAGK